MNVVCTSRSHLPWRWSSLSGVSSHAENKNSLQVRPPFYPTPYTLKFQTVQHCCAALACQNSFYNLKLWGWWSGVYARSVPTKSARTNNHRLANSKIKNGEADREAIEWWLTECAQKWCSQSVVSQMASTCTVERGCSANFGQWIPAGSHQAANSIICTSRFE